MRMAERHMDLEEQRQADEWSEYLAWYDDECKLNELQGEQHESDSTSVH